MVEIKPRVVAIIGGRGKMGKLFAQALKDKNIKVLISDTRTKLSNTEVATQADVVIVGVPIRVTCDVIREIAPHLKSGAMITDFTSIKVKPVETMLKNVREDVEVIGGHPLFGSTDDFRNQNFILCKERVGEYYKWYRTFLEDLGLKVIEMSSEEHDKNMAVIQGLTHMANLSLGHALTSLNCDLKAIEKISTPVYLMGIFNIGRILSQDENLYSDIQMENPYTVDISERYCLAVNEINNIIKKRDRAGFQRVFNDSKKFFGSILEKSMNVIDRLIKEMKN